MFEESVQLCFLATKMILNIIISYIFIKNSSSLSEDMTFVIFLDSLPLLATKKLMTSASIR